MTAFISKLEQDPLGLVGALASSNGQQNSAPADTGGLNPGYAVLRDASDRKLRAPASAADVAAVEGISVYMPTWPAYSDSVQYGEGQMVPFRREGKIWAYCEEAMTPSDTVYVRHTAKGANTVLGAFRNDSDRNAATAAVLGITETDANVDDGTYEVFFRLVIDGVEGEVLKATFTASTTTHADAATGIAAAIEALADVTATPGVEAADKIDITITVDGTTDSLAAFEIVQLIAPSSGTVLSTETQGAENPTCAAHSEIHVDETVSAAGAGKLRLDLV